MARRLAGIRFEAVPAAAAEVLPRMDIAAFVGFAASGPLNVPVAVEDADQFAAIFQRNAILAWDVERGEWATAALGPAVRSFFRNGGRRCWIVRVADSTRAQSNCVGLPGILEVLDAGDGKPWLRPALAWARSEGSWSDNIRVQTELTVDPRPLHYVERAEAQPGALRVHAAAGLRVGDLLRLRYLDAGLVAFMAVQRVALAAVAPRRPQHDDARVPIYSGQAVWFGSHGVAEASPPHAPWTARWAVPRGPAATALAVDVTPGDGQTLEVVLPIALDEAPTPGVFVCLSSTAGGPAASTIWMIVLDVAISGAAVRLRGPAMAQQAPPTALPGHLPMCERLSLSLRAWTNEAAVVLDDLDFVPGAPRYWGALPTDSELFGSNAHERRQTYDGLWQQAINPRFPLAGEDASSAVAGTTPLFTLPLAAIGLPPTFGRVVPPDAAALERDGLATFSRHLFLDHALADALTTEVLGRADDIRYTAPVTRTLNGIHAVLGVEEVTLLAVPDATQRAWQPVAPRPQDATHDPEPQAPPSWGTFLDCAIRTIDAPEMRDPVLHQSGEIALSWSGDGIFELEEARALDFSDARLIHEGSETAWTIFGRSPGIYYFHVRAISGPNRSDWSNGVVAAVASEGGWEIPARGARELPAYDLLSVQRAMLRMCAARGDLFALLALPADYRERQAVEHATLLPPSAAPAFRTDIQMLDLPLSFGERAALSYGALYHPWLVGREEDGQLRRTPPDGAMCGVFARRSLARGAWIAPANERLNGLIALTPPIDRSHWLDLLQAHVNVVRQEPNGFVALSTDTLSLDADLQQINVRRLLQLLRRLALRLGSGFVFESHDDVFRRRVRRSVESVLDGLFVRGAFAGNTPERAYQVVFRSTPQDVDQGRFIVDLRVAPSLPMQFLNVRLAQVGGQTIVTEDR